MFDGVLITPLYINIINVSWIVYFKPLSTNPAKWSHSNNLSAVIAEFFECVLPFCGVGA